MPRGYREGEWSKKMIPDGLNRALPLAHAHTRAVPSVSGKRMIPNDMKGALPLAHACTRDVAF